MKFNCLLLLICFYSLTVHSQSFLGSVNKQVNFRTGPGTDYPVISSLKLNTTVFIVSLDSENDFYNVIDIATDKVGYIHKSFVKIGKAVEKDEQGIFTPDGKSSTYDPEVEIYNNTNRTMSLKLGSNLYSFSPKEKRKLSLKQGSVDYRASAPGVVPYIGTDKIESNMKYSWEFFIVTERR